MGICTIGYLYNRVFVLGRGIRTEGVFVLEENFYRIMKSSVSNTFIFLSNFNKIFHQKLYVCVLISYGPNCYFISYCEFEYFILIFANANITP